MTIDLVLARPDVWSLPLVTLVAVLALAAICKVFRASPRQVNDEQRNAEESTRKPESVNYHFTRQCNYECGFCFHTAKTSFVLPIEEAKRGLRMLKNAGLLK